MAKQLQRAAALLQLLRPGQKTALNATRSFNQFASMNGPSIQQTDVSEEWYMRQRNRLVLGRSFPKIEDSAWIAPNAVVVGDVNIYQKASVWFGSVIRGDLNHVHLGTNAVIMDRCVITTTREVPTGLPAETIIENYVTIEPFCQIRSARVEFCSLVGTRSVLCEGSWVEPFAMLAPGSVLPPARRVPAGELWGGNPAQFIRPLTGTEKKQMEIVALYHGYWAEYFHNETLPHGVQWRAVENWRAKMVAAGKFERTDLQLLKYKKRLEWEAEHLEKVA